MAGPGLGAPIPVWLGEEDLGCIICHGLLDWPATLPCGHSFCRGCLQSLWDAPGAGTPRPWACPTCRQGAARRPRLRKNTLLQDLADKYSRAARELDAGPEAAARRPAPPPPRVAVHKHTTEIAQNLAELVERLVDIVKSLQRQRPVLESGAHNKLGILGSAASSGEELSLEPSSTSEWTMGDMLRDLEEIQEKLQGNITWKEAPEEQTQDMPSSSSCLLPDQKCPAPRRASQFALCTIYPTFDLRTLPCSLEVSRDCRTVTVSRRSQPYPWSPERFSVSQVLCSQALSSGQKYWEVNTRNCKHWAVGVASWGMSRDQMLGRTTDSWCLEWKGSGRFTAWGTAKKTDLDSDCPEIVGIWLDLELGELAYYSVTNQERLLYECKVSTSSPLHPAFWLYGLNPGDSLEIK